MSTRFAVERLGEEMMGMWGSDSRVPTGRRRVCRPREWRRERISRRMHAFTSQLIDTEGLRVSGSTVMGFLVELIDTISLIDLVLVFLLGMADHADLVVLIDEIAAG
jgi:hypothetical protein